MIRSENEKELYKQIADEAEQLPYPLQTVSSEEYGDEFVYDIPMEEREAVLNNLWPFMDIPGQDDIMFDIHSSKFFQFKAAKVIRFEKYNMLVTPYYFESGGTCLDIISEEASQAPEMTVVSIIRK